MEARRKSAASESPAAFRLPYGVEPRRYDIYISPDLSSSTFTGSVRIEAVADEEVTEIVMNAAELSVSAVSLTSSRGPAPRPLVTLEEEHELLRLSLDEPLPPGPVSIEMDFSGTLNDQLHGFYRSTYKDHEGVTRTIATTQFEATDARRAFPCFDEPDRKAVFSVTLDVPEGLSAVSNGPPVEETPLDDGRRRIRFSETIPMSSYLVAWVVGPLVASDPVDVDGTGVRVVHVPGKEHLCDFALEAAAHALRFFAHWFGLAYPAEKLDLVAIPDFAFGAMENLGCITFREVVLLIDPDRASRIELERVADVIAHEIAHMWFGDLVTMKWWNGIWLNEAFATFMELLCVDHFRPQWNRWTGFGLEREVAMATDALHSTRPVEYPVSRPQEADGMFDVLTYQKGASVLRMLEQYLGADRFRDGVRSYLAHHRLRNTETSDLWDSIESTCAEPVREIMDSWIRQGGFPLVSVDQEPRAAGEAQTTLLLSQRPFSYTPSNGASAIGSEWRVPLVGRTLRASEGREPRLLLGREPQSLVVGHALDGAGGGDLVLFNAHGYGYYRVRYPEGYLKRLAGEMRSLETVERSNLIGDTWASVVADQSPLGDFLVLAEALGDERDPDVWSRVTSALVLLDHAVPNETRSTLAAYTRALLGPVFAKLGFGANEDDDEQTPDLRAQLLGLLGTVGQDPAIRAQCAQLEEQELSGRARIDPNLAGAVATVVAASGGDAEFQSFLERFRHPETPQEESRYRQALAGFSDHSLAARVFELAMTEVRTQDVPFVLQALLTSRENGAATWARVKGSWDHLVEVLPGQGIPRLLEGVRFLCRDPELAEDVEKFVSAHPLRTRQRSVEQTLERLRINVSFASRISKEAEEVLSAGTARLGFGSGDRRP